MDHVPSPPRGPRRRRRPLSARLDDEWRILRHRQHLIERARQWEATDRPFEHLDALLRCAGHHAPSTPCTDAVMSRLVDVARTDHLASRVVLQRMLPGLMAVVRRRHSLDIDGSFEQLLGAAWLAIRHYRTDLRPRRIAANLVRDATYRAFIAPARRMSATEVSVDPHALDEAPAVIVLSSGEELALLLAEAREMGLDATDLDFVKAFLRCGSSQALAAEWKVTTRTVRNHRARTAATLRHHALVA